MLRRNPRRRCRRQHERPRRQRVPSSEVCSVECVLPMSLRLPDSGAARIERLGLDLERRSPGAEGRQTNALFSAGMTVSRPVGGVLFVLSDEVTIHLSGLPGDCSRGAGEQPMSHVWPCSGWGLPSRPSHPDRWCALTAPFHPCLCGLAPAIGGLLSVALSFGSPRLAASQHPALWSPDLPRPGPRPRTSPWRGHPADSPSDAVCQVAPPTDSPQALCRTVGDHPPR